TREEKRFASSACVWRNFSDPPNISSPGCSRYFYFFDLSPQLDLCCAVEELLLTTSTSGSRSSYVYAGLAGETAPGRVVKSGLYRMANDDGGWELLTSGLPEAPVIRAIAAHPLQPEVMYVGTQHGPYRSTDYGNHWEKVNIRDHGLPVWSLMFHPRDPKLDRK